jgi:hypothetical protein
VRPAAIGTLLGAVVGALLWSCSVNRVSDGFKCTTHADCDPDRMCTQNYCVIGPRPLVDAAPQPIDAAVCPAACGGTCNFSTMSCTIIGTGSGNITCPTGWNCNIMCPTSGACGTINCISAASCDIDCTADNACLGITCNTHDCKVDCTGQKACGNIACTTGDCTVNCSGGSGSAACGTISCTTGDCTATCAGSAACGAMSCTTGACTETCSGGSAACGTLDCGTGPCLATCTGLEPACGQVNCASSCKCDVSCNGTTNACPAVMNCPDRAPGAAYCTAGGSNGERCLSTFASQCNNC